MGKAHKECGTHRLSGAPQRRVHKAGRRERSKGYRVAWEKRWGRVSGGAHLITDHDSSTLRHCCTSPAFHCFNRPHLCQCYLCGLPADPYPQLHSCLCFLPLVYGWPEESSVETHLIMSLPYRGLFSGSYLGLRQILTSLTDVCPPPTSPDSPDV